MTGLAQRVGVRRARGPLLAGAVGAALLGLLSVIDPAGGPVLCPFKAVTGWDCPGCGGTRGLHDLLHGDVAGALDHNVLLVIAVPLVLVGWLTWLRRTWRGDERRVEVPTAAVWVALAFLVGFWVVRNLPGMSYLGSA